MVSPKTNCALQQKPTLSEPQVRREVADSKGRYVIDHAGGGTSELTYSILSATRVIADHTEVADGHEGEGIGLALVSALVADAKAEGVKIIPLCPFVNAQRRRHPDWAEQFDV